MMTGLSSLSATRAIFSGPLSLIKAILRVSRPNWSVDTSIQYRGRQESHPTNKDSEHMKALKEVYRELKHSHNVDLLDIKENDYLRDWLSSSSQ